MPSRVHQFKPQPKKKSFRQPPGRHLVQLMTNSSTQRNSLDPLDVVRRQSYGQGIDAAFFRRHKSANAEKCLHEIDRRVTGGLIGQMTASTGGVEVLWNSRLTVTAGRCRYERSGNDHYATIELSDKLVDDPVRLLSTLAHEFCHLANDMLGDDPRAHGFGFKEWSRKYKAALSDVGVEVTTYHNFSPKFKFIWICSNDECGEEIGRHSNSIDPEKQGCPHCGSNLVQTNPVARVLKSRREWGFLG
ncbi:hypothetical protein KCU61_g890, partial [Aureobasidium melanogenum]